MKKLKYNISLWLCVVMAFTMTLTSCQEEAPTVPTLSAFGPLPVVRGDSLQFLGTNLNLVTELIVPEGIVIAKDAFINPTSTSFTIIVPQETKVGKVILKYTGGEITSKANLVFEEPIEFANIITPSEAVRAGDEISIKGDYLANIVSVTFAGDVTVDTTAFTLCERKEIKVAVPKAALSGYIYLTDASGDQFYSPTKLAVNQPTIVSFSPAIIKAGADLTITGTDLDLVENIVFGGGETVNVADFVSVSKTSIKITTPATLADDKVTIVSYAKVEVASATDLEALVPSNITVAAETVFKTGLKVVISGADLDLVSAIKFTGGEDIAATDLLADDKLTVTIPDNAKDGIITLTMLSTKTVETSAITLVVPTGLTTDKSEYMTEDDIIISGSDLDLVAKVTLAGVEEVMALESDQLKVTTTKASKSGKLVLILKNGTEVTVVDNLTVTLKAEVKVTSEVPATAQVGDEITLTGSGFNKFEAMFIGETKVINYIARTDASITFTVPSDTPEGEHEIKFLLTTGVEETLPNKITIVGAVLKVPIWTGSNDFGGWSNFEDFSWNKTEASTKLMAELKEGATIVFKGEAVANAQIKIVDPKNGWAPYPEFVAMPGFVSEYGVIDMPAGAVDFRLSVNESLGNMQAAGIVLQGKNWVMTEVYLEYPAN